MNLYEAKQIAEKHGFKVAKSKKGGNDKVPPWAKLDEGKKDGDKVPPWAKLNEGKKDGDKVPPWAKLEESKKGGNDKVPPWAKLDEGKKDGDKVPPWAKLEEAKAIVEKAGFKAVGGGFGTAEGTLFTKVYEKYVNNGYFLTLASTIGFTAAIAELLEDVRKCIGKGVSPEYYNKFAIRMKASKNPTFALQTITNAMLAGEGMALH